MGRRAKHHPDGAWKSVRGVAGAIRPVGLTRPVLEACVSSEGSCSTANWHLLLGAIGGGIADDELRREVWPLLLGCWLPVDDADTRAEKANRARRRWERLTQQAHNSADAERRYSAGGAAEGFTHTVRRIATGAVRMAFNIPCFQEPERGESVRRLQRLLEAFALYDPETGYCQGMSDLAAPFIHLFKEDWMVLWTFTALMSRLRLYFQTGMHHMYCQMGRLSRLLASVDPGLYRHLEAASQQDCRFAFQMLLCCFSREVPWPQLQLLWECMWAHEVQVGEALHVYVAAALLLRNRRSLMACGALEDVVQAMHHLPPPSNPAHLLTTARVLWASQQTVSASRCGCYSLGRSSQPPIGPDIAEPLALFQEPPAEEGDPNGRCGDGAAAATVAALAPTACAEQPSEVSQDCTAGVEQKLTQSQALRQVVGAHLATDSVVSTLDPCAAPDSRCVPAEDPVATGTELHDCSSSSSSSSSSGDASQDGTAVAEGEPRRLLRPATAYSDDVNHTVVAVAIVTGGGSGTSAKLPCDWVGGGCGVGPSAVVESVHCAAPESVTPGPLSPRGEQQQGQHGGGTPHPAVSHPGAINTYYDCGGSENALPRCSVSSVSSGGADNGLPLPLRGSGSGFSSGFLSSSGSTSLACSCIGAYCIHQRQHSRQGRGDTRFRPQASSAGGASYSAGHRQAAGGSGGGSALQPAMSAPPPRPPSATTEGPGRRSQQRRAPPAAPDGAGPPPLRTVQGQGQGCSPLTRENSAPSRISGSGQGAPPWAAASCVKQPAWTSQGGSTEPLAKQPLVRAGTGGRRAPPRHEGQPWDVRLREARQGSTRTLEPLPLRFISGAVPAVHSDHHCGPAAAAAVSRAGSAKWAGDGGRAVRLTASR